jgi:hypothetical protein
MARGHLADITGRATLKFSTAKNTISFRLRWGATLLTFAA